MTLCLGIRCKDVANNEAVVLASDRTCSLTDRFKTEVKKIDIDEKVPIAFCGAGAASVIHGFSEDVIYELTKQQVHNQPDLKKYQTICSTVTNLKNKLPPDNEIMIAFSLSSGNAFLITVGRLPNQKAAFYEDVRRSKYEALGSGVYTGARFILENLLEPYQDISIDEAAELSVLTIALVHSIDHSISLYSDLIVTVGGKIGYLEESSYYSLLSNVSKRRELFKAIWHKCASDEKYERSFKRFIEKEKWKERLKKKFKGGGKVLFIDDIENASTEYGKELNSMLANEGIQLVFEKDEPKGINKIRRDVNRNIQAVLLDIEFENQELQGPDIFREIKNLRPDIPIIILTIKDSYSEFETFNKMGALLYIVKKDLPKKKKELLEILKPLPDKMGYKYKWTWKEPKIDVNKV